MAPSPRRAKRWRFKNNTTGGVGIIKVDRKGEDKSLNCEGLGYCDLTADEIEATISAYKPGKDPFTQQARVFIKDPETGDENEHAPIVHRDEATGDIIREIDAPFLELEDPSDVPPVLKAHLAQAVAVP